MKKTRNKRILAFIMMLVMLFTMLPDTAVYATEAAASMQESAEVTAETGQEDESAGDIETDAEPESGEASGETPEDDDDAVAVTEDLAIGEDEISTKLAADGGMSEAAKKYIIWQSHSGISGFKAKKSNWSEVYSEIQKTKIAGTAIPKYNFTPHVTSSGSNKTTMTVSASGYTTIKSHNHSDKTSCDCFASSTYGTAYKLGSSSKTLSCRYTNTGIWRKSATEAYNVDVVVSVQGYSGHNGTTYGSTPYVTFKTNKIGIAVCGVDTIKLKYDFYINGTNTRIYPDGFVSIYDIDAQQGVHLDSSAWKSTYCISGASDYLAYYGSDSGPYIFARSQAIHDTSETHNRTMVTFEASNSMTTTYTFMKCKRGETFTYNNKSYSTAGSGNASGVTYLGVPLDNASGDTAYMSAWAQGMIDFTANIQVTGEGSIEKSIYSGNQSGNYAALQKQAVNYYAQTAVDGEVTYRIRTFIPLESTSSRPGRIEIVDLIAPEYDVDDSSIKIYGNNASQQYADLTDQFTKKYDSNTHILDMYIQLSNKSAADLDWLTNNTYDLYFTAKLKRDKDGKVLESAVEPLYRDSNQVDYYGGTTVQIGIGSSGAAASYSSYTGETYTPTGGNVAGKYAVGNDASLLYVKSAVATKYTNKTKTTHAMTLSATAQVKKVSVDYYDPDNKALWEPLAGAVLRLWKLNGGSWVKTDRTVTTGDDGLARFTDLFYDSEGGEYCITEEKAPKGYILNQSYVYKIDILSGDWWIYGSDIKDETVRVTDAGISNIDSADQEGKMGVNTGTLDFVADENMPMKDRAKDRPKPVKITKKSRETGENLSGAVFTLYEWNKYDNVWDKLEDLEENEKGVYLSSEIEHYKESTDGRYRVEETKAPEGTVNEGWSKEFTWDGEDISGEYIFEAAVDNPMPKGKLNIYKKDSKTGKAMAGVKFRLTAAEDIKTKWGTVLIEKGSVVGEDIVTDQNGYASREGLYIGKYTLEETETDDYHWLKKGGVEIAFEYPDDDTTAVVEKAVDVTNDPLEPSLAISKLADLTTGVTYDKNTGRYKGEKLPGLYYPKQRVTFTIKAYNNGDTDLTDVVLTDTMSEQLKKYIDVGSAAFNIPEGSVTDEGNAVKVQSNAANEIVLDRLLKGDTFTITYTVNVAAKYKVDPNDVLDNVITAKAKYKDIEVTPPDDLDRITVEEPNPQFAIAKLADKTKGAKFDDESGRYTGDRKYGTYEYDKWIVYTIQVTNTGNVDFTKLTLTDVMSEELLEYIDKSTAAFVMPEEKSVASKLGDTIALSMPEKSVMVLDHLNIGDNVKLSYRVKLNKNGDEGKKLANTIKGTAEHEGDTVMTKDDTDKINVKPNKGEVVIRTPGGHVVKTGDITGGVAVLFVLSLIMLVVLYFKKNYRIVTVGSPFGKRKK